VKRRVVVEAGTPSTTGAQLLVAVAALPLPCAIALPPEKVRNPREFEEISITDDRKRKRARIKKPAEMCGFFIPDAQKGL